MRIAASVLLVVWAWLLAGCDGAAGPKETVTVGILHSQSGPLADSEKPVIDATILAIEEINEQELIPGVELEYIIADGRSEPATFAREAERLIKEENVVVLFGCWTSASRKAVKPIVEKYNSLLFYPVQYEGIESSPNIVYLGAAPNQQIIPAVHWAMEELGDKVFLVGSDYVFPHTANTIIKDQVNAMGGEITGEVYLPLAQDDLEPSQIDALIEEIKTAEPDVILNTLNGEVNQLFFQKLRQAGVSAEDIPTLSFSVGESELRSGGQRSMAGDYAAWNYFQTVRTPENSEFLKALRKRFGENRTGSDPMEA
ncbi:MAG: urea ABC transporter substrate-binding protein, partial [Verrucomicrobiota bacterium]